MSNTYIGEIRMFAGNYAPKNWAVCSGQELPINQFPKLFKLIGYTYGGTPNISFCLPNLRGKVPIHHGKGKGLSNYTLGQHCGSEYVTLEPDELPKHSHSFKVSNMKKNLSENPENKIVSNTDFNLYSDKATNLVELWEDSITPSGESSIFSHYNMQPYLCITFIICISI